MGDLLKEAIADAKAVRETALANAKMALEEAFTPQLKSMLSAKLREDDDEFGDEEEIGGEEEIGDEELGGEEEVPAEEETYEDEEAGEEDLGGEEELEAEPEVGDDEEVEEEGLELEDIIRELESELSEEEEEDDEPVVDETIEVNGVRYAPIKEAEEGEEGEEEVGGDDEEVEESYEIDDSVFTEGDDEEEEPVEEQSQSSNIGSGDNKVDVADAGDEEDPEGGPGTAVYKMGESVKAELAEYKEAVHFLKDKLHEVNILNAKLLFTNKLFREFVLDNGQKMKVVETFDRAQTTREIKLVYSTLAEQFGDNGGIGRKKSIKESASAKTGSTKPSKESKKVISEETEVADRFRKLAGILKG